MAGDTLITVVGNLVDDPELRFTPSGSAVANFRIASTPRIFDRATNEWKDGDSLYLTCNVWRQYEVMVILDPELEERTVAPSLDAFLNVVKIDGGSVDKVDIWGRRRLAYEIDKRSEGIYAVLDLTCTPAAVAELDRQLNLNDAVLRTKVLRPAAH